MADPRPNSSKKQRSSQDWWREDGDPAPNAGVHRPADFIDEIIRLAGMADGIDEERLRSMWAELVGTYIAQGSIPESLKRGTLTIRVVQPAMRFHLEQMKGSLLEKIRQHPCGEKIQVLRFAHG